MIDVNKILFRCSSLGYIMTEPRDKSPKVKLAEQIEALGISRARYANINKETKTAKKLLSKIEGLEESIKELDKIKDEPFLSETCKGHLADKYVSIRYGRESDVESRYLKKGLLVEEDSITLYSRLKKQVFRKNEEQISNEFICGTPDAYQGKVITQASLVVDTKSSWDVFTFHRSRVKDLAAMYYWQGMGYCDLTNSSKTVIAYCLIDTPHSLIYDEQNRLKWKMGVINPESDESYLAACAEIERNMTYGDIPLEEKMFERVIMRDDDAIERIHKRVAECRAYMQKHFFAGQLLETKMIEA